LKIRVNPINPNPNLQDDLRVTLRVKPELTDTGVNCSCEELGPILLRFDGITRRAVNRQV